MPLAQSTFITIDRNGETLPWLIIYAVVNIAGFIFHFERRYCALGALIVLNINNKQQFCLLSIQILQYQCVRKSVIENLQASARKCSYHGLECKNSINIVLFKISQRRVKIAISFLRQKNCDSYCMNQESCSANQMRP